jgi:hypothetical protein
VTRTSSNQQAEDAVRWIAIRHAPDHVHLVALLARQDGRKAHVWRDFYQVGQACRAAEQRFGLTPTAPFDKTAAKQATRAESEKAARQGRAEPSRVTLRQHVAEAAAASSSEAGFFSHLGKNGVGVRVRHSTRDPGQVTGYAVSLPGDTGRDGQPVWYSGGKLAADLTLPRLRARWDPDRADPVPDCDPRDPGQESAIWDQAERAAWGAARAVRADPAAAADVAWAAGDFLRAASAVTGSADLAGAADVFDRAARELHGRIPPPAPAGAALRGAARALYVVASASDDKTSRQTVRTMALMLQIVALIEQIAWLRDVQRRQAQASAAYTAARQVRAAHAAAKIAASRAPYQPRRNRPQDAAARSFPGGTIADALRAAAAAPPPAARRAPPRPGPRRQPRGRAP